MRRDLPGPGSAGLPDGGLGEGRPRARAELARLREEWAGEVA